MPMSQMSDRELEGGQAFVYLDLDHPLVAWGVARGVLLSARHIATKVDEQALPISFMLSSLLEVEGNPRFVNEQIIEEARCRWGPSDTGRDCGGCFAFLTSVRRSGLPVGATISGPKT